MLLKDLLFVFWFFAPAGLANLAAFGSGKIPLLKPYNYPVDGGLQFRKRRILGSHKTVRGFIAGFLAAIFCVYLEVYLYRHVPFIQTISAIDYTTIHPELLGALLGVGALAGDAVKSFFKRQTNIPPGRSWVPFDQVDYIVGGVLLSFFYIQLTIFQYMLLFALFVFLHPIYNFMGYLLKLRKDPFG
jgi:CDP-2,3-bis-(O-geranylgeranyl)-sn-glycerol synthase